MINPHSASAATELARLALELRNELPRLVEVQLKVLTDYVPYRDVPPEELTPSCTRNALRVLGALQGDTSISPGTEDEQQSLRTRMQQGVSGDDALDAYRAVVAVLRDEVLAQARAHGVPAEILLIAIERIWTLHDEVMSTMVSTRHKVELSMLARQQSGRGTFFSQLLDGGLTPEELTDVGPRYDLHPSAEYWFALSDDTRDDTVAVIEQEGHGEGRRALIGFHHGRVAGLICRPLTPLPAFEQTTVACVGPYPAAESHRAAIVGADLLRAAKIFALKGVVTEERLGLRLAVVRELGVGELLHQRFIAPLGTGPAADDTISTVRAFLAAGRSVPAAAEQLFVHANTVRYRLAKFCDLTGADFESTESVAELWWAFEHLTVRLA